MGFRKHETSLVDLFIIKPDLFGDDRGFFTELYNQKTFEDLGLGHLNFLQDNLSFSTKGTLRGLHFQTPPYSQGKLVTALEGSVLDVAVDLRKNSPSFGKVFSMELNSNELTMLFIPPGFAHGFQVLSDTCLFFYKCTNTYNKDSEGGIAWDDPALNIPWRDIEPVVSEKDQCHPVFSSYESPF